MSLFGTDGIRGPVGLFPVDAQSFLQLGWALGQFAQQKRVLLAKDTRLSGYMLESSLSAGLTAAGCDVFLTGPLPTPALAYLTQSLGAEIGIMISASHNPYHDNGVKVFYQGANKLTDAQQDLIESLFHRPMVTTSNMGKLYRLSDAPGRYLEFLKRHVSLTTLKNKVITLDCAHGAAYKVAPQIFEEYQSVLHVLNNEPNGFNINENCGVICGKSLEQYMARFPSHYGIAFDGDADRVTLYIDGKKCDPHYMLLMLYDLYKRRYNYTGGIIGTQLHNQGLISYCQKNHIPWIEVPVGDRYLIGAAKKTGFKVAGEPSGHYILMDQLPTADGLLIALMLIEEMESGHAKTLEWYETNVPLLPSYSRSFAVTSSPRAIVALPHVQNCIAALRQTHSSLKIVVRPSGTELLIRCYVEGNVSSEIAEKLMHHIYEVIIQDVSCTSAELGACFAKNIDSQLEASLG